MQFKIKDLLTWTLLVSAIFAFVRPAWLRETLDDNKLWQFAYEAAVNDAYTAQMRGEAWPPPEYIKTARMKHPVIGGPSDE